MGKKYKVTILQKTKMDYDVLVVDADSLQEVASKFEEPIVIFSTVEGKTTGIVRDNIMQYWIDEIEE